MARHGSLAANDNHHVEIPQSATQRKPIFDDVPGDDITLEIISFVQETGKPYLWRGHSHDKPDEGSSVFYLEEFSLPSWCKDRSTWAPCPCCSPRSPKFRDLGKIAYFPEEKTIRLIGPECFAAISGEGHSGALADLRRRRSDKRNTRQLAESIDRVSECVRVIDERMQTAKDIDAFASSLRKALNSIDVNLWDEARSGSLMVINHVSDVDKFGNERSIQVRSSFGHVCSANVISPTRKRVSKLLGDARQKLITAYWDAKKKVATPEDRAASLKALMSALSRVDRVISAVDSDVLFMNQRNQSVLSSWAEHEGCPVDLIWEFKGTSLIVSRKKHRYPVHLPIRGRLVNLAENIQSIAA